MSPEGPRFPAELNAHESGDEKKNKRSKKGAAVRLPNGIVPVEKPFEGTQTKPAELSAIEKMLADLAAKRAETTSKPNQKLVLAACHHHHRLLNVLNPCICLRNRSVQN
jgi:hypothetical protein